MVIKLVNVRHEMAQNPPSPIDKTPPLGAREERYLDLWEENIRLLAANGPVQKNQNENG
jgi:hypothetical protein